MIVHQDQTEKTIMFEGNHCSPIFLVRETVQEILPEENTVPSDRTDTPKTKIFFIDQFTLRSLSYRLRLLDRYGLVLDLFKKDKDNSKLRKELRVLDALTNFHGFRFDRTVEAEAYYTLLNIRKRHMRYSDDCGYLIRHHNANTRPIFSKAINNKLQR